MGAGRHEDRLKTAILRFCLGLVECTSSGALTNWAALMNPWEKRILQAFGFLNLPMAKIMDPVLPILCIWGYRAIILGSLEVQVGGDTIGAQNPNSKKVCRSTAIVLIGINPTPA